MPSLLRNQTSSCANPVLDLFTAINGQLIDVAILQYQIFDISDATKRLDPVQVYPGTIGARAPVDVTTACPAGDKISTGRYLARWTVPVNEPIGTHSIKWFFQLTSSAPEQTFTEEFEILPSVSGFSVQGYATVQDLRDEGISIEVASDARLDALIRRASRFIERMTSRFFEARSQTLTLDGSGSSLLLLDNPIISVSSLKISGSLISPDSYKVYNRHIRQGLLNPDDRDNPKIELDGVFRRGNQNIELTGVFGYTDPDGSETGTVPDMIRHVTKLLVIRELTPMMDVANRAAMQNAGRIKSEQTRDQSYELFDNSSGVVGTITGNAEIDIILEQYRAPMRIGSV